MNTVSLLTGGNRGIGRRGRRERGLGGDARLRATATAGPLPW